MYHTALLQQCPLLLGCQTPAAEKAPDCGAAGWWQSSSRGLLQWR